MKIIIKIFLYVILIFIAITFILPFLWMVRSSLMRMSQIFILPPVLVPNPVKFVNYVEAMTIVPFGRYFLNTLTILFFSLIGILSSSISCAYGFSRIQWKGRELVFKIILTAIMLPAAVTLIPTFIGWKTLGFYNTFIPLIVPYYFGGGVFNVFLLRQFFRSIPFEYDEAARVDGAGPLKILFSIILPLSRSAIIVVAVFSFIAVWNDFFGPLIYLDDSDKFTLSIALQQFQGFYSSEWHLMMAASTVVILPTVIVFILGQKFFIKGIIMSGLKG